MLNFKHIIMLLALVILLALPKSISAAVSLVQKSEVAPQSTSTNLVSASATYTAPPTSGNLMVAIVSGDITGAVTAPAGWSTAISEAFTTEVVGAQTFQIPSQAIFYKIAGAGEAQVVTFQYPSDPDANVGIQLYEYSGIVAVTPLSGVNSSSGHLDTDAGTAGFQVSSGAVSPAAAALLLAGFASRPLDAAPIVNGGTGNANFNAYTNSFSEQANMSTGEVPCDTANSGCYGIAGLDRITNAPGSFSASATLAPTQGGWRGQIVAFQAAAPTASSAKISGRILDNSGNPLAGVVIRLSGTQNRTIITDANGNYVFDNVAVNGFYTLAPARTNYAFVPEERSFNQQGNLTEAMFTATSLAAAGSPLAMPEFFVRQHYLDFLGREPDESGFNFWSDQIRNCGSDADCLERRTINVSAAYFFSIEFQETGGLVDRLYGACYDRAPVYSEFMPDTASVAQDFSVGTNNWEARLETNKQAFVEAWVRRAEFRAAYDSLSNATYLDRLLSHTHVNFSTSERAALLNELETGAISRAVVLRRIVENDAFRRARFNQAFVMMEYFGYLRRDPDAAGYRFWLNKLNEFGGNFERAEMVKAFITSTEYRNRFPR